MRYTDDPSYFIPPTQATVEHIARREGLGELSPVDFNFIWDLLAKTAGAEVRDFDEAAAQAEAATYAMEEAEAFMARNSKSDRWSVVEAFENDYHEHQRQLYDALVEVDLNKIPGYNKPTQAVRLLGLFRAMQRLWVLGFIALTLKNSFFAALADAFAKVDALDAQQMAMLETFVGGDEPADDATLLGLELSVSGIQVAEMLRIARKLSELAELQQDKAKPTPDPNGEDVSLRSIEEISELGKAMQSAFTLPHRLRMQRAVSGELDVRNPRTRRAQKQLLFMVVDGSGSMWFDDAAIGASRAAGVVMNRLEAVVKGEAELYLRFFDGALRKEEFHADSPATARELMRIVSDPAQYMGGSTEFAGTLARASQRAEEILTERGLRDPEIVFVTDGLASVPDLSVLGENTLHTFQVGATENQELSALARKSGGVGVYLGLHNWR